MMISKEESIPVKNNDYRIAEEIFYSQFNDVSFFVEDKDQENFYFCILRNLFPEMRIEKIFPLEGKENVINESKNNIGDNKKIYIVDKDFDDLLGKTVNQPNLFYLERYSIENYLFEKDALIDYIIGEKPRLHRGDVNKKFDFECCVDLIGNALNNLIYLHLIVQNKCPKLKNINLNHERFFSFNNGDFEVKHGAFQKYIDDIQNEFDEIDKRLKVNSQLRKAKKTISINTVSLFLKHMPGKYLIKMMKQFIESKFSLVSRNIESFCYRIAEKCKFESLDFLKVQINHYLQ